MRAQRRRERRTVEKRSATERLLQLDFVEDTREIVADDRQALTRDVLGRAFAVSAVSFMYIVIVADHGV